MKLCAAPTRLLRPGFDSMVEALEKLLGLGTRSFPWTS